MSAAKRIANYFGLVLVATSLSCSSFASDCKILRQTAEDDLPGALFVVAANVTAQRDMIRKNPDFNPLEFDLPSHESAISVGNAFLVAIDGDTGLVLTAKHVVMEVCSGIDGNTDRGIYLAWPGTSLQAEKLVRAYSPRGLGVSCSAESKDPVLGTDIAFLVVKLSEFTKNTEQFEALPIATRFWSELSGSSAFQSFKIAGYLPRKHFQRIAEPITQAQLYSDSAGHRYKGVFDIGNNLDPGFSGSAILGFTPNNEYAVVGLATNSSVDWVVSKSAVQPDTIAQLANDQLKWNIGAATNGLGIDLGYISKTTPEVSSDEFVTQILNLSREPQTERNRIVLNQISKKLERSFDQALLVSRYALQREASYRTDPQNTILFEENMIRVETQWCWDTDAFDSFAQTDIKKLSNSNIDKKTRRELAESGQVFLDQAGSAGRARVTKLSVTQLKLAHAHLEAATNSTTLTPLVAQYAIDRDTSIVRLVMADPNPESLALLDKEFPPGGQLRLNELGLEKSAADARIQAAKAISDSDKKTNLIKTSIDTYDAILRSNKADAPLVQETTKARLYADSLSRMSKSESAAKSQSTSP